MIKVNFYETAPDEKLKFAVIASCKDGKWLWCKHKERDIYEIPGGHREQGEDITETARRELYEETGAVKFDLSPVCVYGVEKDGEETLGMLFYAEVQELECELHSEIERVEYLDGIPERLTYPLIQPHLFKRVMNSITDIKIATEDDFETLKNHDRHISESALKKLIADENILVATVGGEFAGWLRYGWFWDEIPFMNMLFLLEKFRGAHIGEKLVIEWEKLMAENGAKRVMTSTQADEWAQHFYRKLGYADIGGFNLSGETYELIMEKNL